MRRFSHLFISFSVIHSSDLLSCLSIHPSIHHFIWSSICLSLSVYPSFYPSVLFPFLLLFYLIFYSFVHSFMFLLLFFIYPSICFSSVHSFILLIVHLFVRCPSTNILLFWWVCKFHIFIILSTVKYFPWTKFQIILWKWAGSDMSVLPFYSVVTEEAWSTAVVPPPLLVGILNRLFVNHGWTSSSDQAVFLTGALPTARLGHHQKCCSCWIRPRRRAQKRL